MFNLSVFERHFGCVLSLGVCFRVVVGLFGCECPNDFEVENVGQARPGALKVVWSEYQTIGIVSVTKCVGWLFFWFLVLFCGFDEDAKSSFCDEKFCFST